MLYKDCYLLYVPWPDLVEVKEENTRGFVVCFNIWACMGPVLLMYLLPLPVWGTSTVNSE